MATYLDLCNELMTYAATDKADFYYAQDTFARLQLNGQITRENKALDDFVLTATPEEIAAIFEQVYEDDSGMSIFRKRR